MEELLTNCTAKRQGDAVRARPVHLCLRLGSWGEVGGSAVWLPLARTDGSIGGRRRRRDPVSHRGGGMKQVGIRTIAGHTSRFDIAPNAPLSKASLCSKPRPQHGSWRRFRPRRLERICLRRTPDFSVQMATRGRRGGKPNYRRDDFRRSVPLVARKVGRAAWWQRLSH
jgi:hypothetical protein